jgi:hypothetical protein
MSGIISENSARHTGLVKASSGGGGVWNLIQTLTASGSANLSFTTGIDSTYDEYVFKFINMHPATDDVTFNVNFRDGSTAYDATKTSTFFRAFHNESGVTAALQYQATQDLAQSTSAQPLANDLGNDNDQSCSGELFLYNPSSTTFAKHFMANVELQNSNQYSYILYTAGYCNVTAAIDGVQFAMSSGNIDSGQISLYGIS